MIPDHEMSSIASDAPMMEPVLHGASGLLEAAQAVAVLMHGPSDTLTEDKMASGSIALQAIIRLMHESGVPDCDVFKTIASFLGWWATRQSLAPEEKVLEQLMLKGLIAAQMSRKAHASGFPTIGKA